MAITLRVHKTTWLAHGVVRVDLRHPDGEALPEWQPGAHLTLHLANGLQRQYSLCGDPADRHVYSVAVLREPASRGGSAWVHERLTAGTLLDVDSPRNNFPLIDADRYLLIAGGIGITPILPMARHLAARGRPWQLLYCGRSRDSMAFLPDLGRDEVTVHADDERDGPPDLTSALAEVAPGTAVYCCGPEPLLAAVERAVPDGVDLHVERFRAVATPTTATGDTAFDVVCAGSGTTVRVTPDVSILDALATEGITVPSSCREGVCGTCETKVLSGEPDHRDVLLTDDEKASGATMLPCVSRCRSSELVLDLS